MGENVIVNERHWVINNTFSSEKVLPDLNRYIFTKRLEQVEPEAVNTR